MLPNIMKSSPSNRSTQLLAVLSLALLPVLLPGLTGCAATITPVAGGGVVTYQYRDLNATLAEDYDKVVEASRRAVKDLEFARVSDNKDAYAARLVVRTALDKKVEITVTNSGKNMTNIKIRVGLVGDQTLSMAIFDKIKAGL